MPLSIVNAPAVSRLIDVTLRTFPEHERFLARRFEGARTTFLEPLAELILALASPNVARVAADYRWMCDRVLEEELHFRRTGRYRLASFAEAQAAVYDDREYMTRYMNGLLLSQLFWKNHSDAIE